MVAIKCPCCEFLTPDLSDVLAAAGLNTHVVVDHANNHVVAQAQPRRTPKVDRPLLKDNISEETWNAFKQSWDIFVRGNDVAVVDRTVQLYSSCDMGLKTKLTAMHQNILDQPVDEVLKLLKDITVTPVALTVKRNELLQMQQDAGEKIRTFYSRVKGKAITCKFR